MKPGSSGLPTNAGVLIDFGSTYTKIRIVDVESGVLTASGQAPTHVDNLVTSLDQAIASVGGTLTSSDLSNALTLASSSAAGGLKIVAIGLTRELTTRAATQAALGAGGKLVGVYAGGLTKGDVSSIEASRPDLILLAGGTDGGNHSSVTEDSRRLAASSIDSPIIVAGNRNAVEAVSTILTSGEKAHYIADNVLPSLDRLEVEVCRGLIREVFMSQIVRAKGLEQIEDLIGRVIMPTPQAVLYACQLIADGGPKDGQDGVGDVMAVDIGGATTDVYSIANGAPASSGTVVRGLPEPRSKRTVEGDLGLRINAEALYEIARSATFAEGLSLDHQTIADHTSKLAADPTLVPTTSEEVELDLTLSEMATLVGVRRHSGTVEVHYGPEGAISIQRGKDLSKIRTLVATGGVVAANKGIIEDRLIDVINSDEYPGSLTPKGLQRVVPDSTYSLFAIGLLSTVDADLAFRLGVSSIITQ